MIRSYPIWPSLSFGPRIECNTNFLNIVSVYSLAAIWILAVENFAEPMNLEGGGGCCFSFARLEANQTKHACIAHVNANK